MLVLAAKPDLNFLKTDREKILALQVADKFNNAGVADNNISVPN
jgi:hypothetical protein